MDKLKKILSLLLAAAFITAALPLSALTSFAESSELTLSDGSVWLADKGEDAALTVISEGDYKITTATDASAKANFKLMPKTRFSALCDSISLSCDYRDGAASFGFKTDYSLDGLRGNSNGYGSIEFYRLESGNTTYVQMYINGTAVTVSSFTATRATLQDIGIVEQNGSYYVKYGAQVLNGSGCSEEIQNAVKLENYFPRELLENSGMLYFFFTANSISSGNGARVIIHNSVDGYYRSYSHNVSGDRNTPTSWTVTPDKAKATFDNGNCVLNAGTGGTEAILGTPVATVKAGQTESGQFAPLNTFSKNPAGNRYNYFDFSNDPTFSDSSTETLTLVCIQNSNTAHVIYGDKTVGFSAMFNSGVYWWKFKSDGTDITGLDIGDTSFTGFGKLKVDKPIYLRIRKTHYSDGITLTVNVVILNSTYNEQVAALETSVADAAKSEDIYAAKAAVDAFYASELRYAVSYETECAASDIIIAYENKIRAEAAAVDSAIEALPSIDSLMYQDKAEVEAVRAKYDALSSSAQALVKKADLLAEYEKATAELKNDGRYRTSDGSVYRVVYNSEGIALGSDEENGALKASVVGAASNEKSELGVVTEKKFPIVSGSYEMSQYFGTKDNSGRFGFSADDCEDIFDGGYSNSFIMYRTEYGNNTKLYTLIDGKTVECYALGSATRARLWTVGVTKQNGSWYVTVDGVAITGEGYSAEVQESLKLENHFSREFLENNYSVHFFMYAKSMHGAAYLRPTVSIENNTVLDVRDRIGVANNGISGIAEKNIAKSSLTESENGNIYNFDVPSAGSVILSEPLNKNGFSVKANMPIASGDQWVYYSFSNDPDFLTDDTVTVIIVQFKNVRQNTVVYNGKECTRRFSGFYGGTATWTMSFTEVDGKYRLKPFTSGTTDLIVSEADFTALMDKPIYLKITGGAGTEPNITLTNSVEDKPVYSDSAALDKATEAYLAEESTALGNSVDSQISEIYADKVNFVYSRDAVNTLMAQRDTLSARQKAAIKNSAQLDEIYNYLISLANTDAESLAACRKLLLGSADPAENYDFYHDGTVDIRDLVRIKKICAENEKKN